VEVDVGEQRADDAPLRGAGLGGDESAVLLNAGAQPAAEQPEDAPILDPVLHKAHQVCPIQTVEAALDVDVQHVAHLLPDEGLFQRGQRLVGGALRPEAVRAGQEVLLVDRLQHQSDRPLDELVLQGGNPDRARSASLFREVDAPHRLGPVLLGLDPCLQRPEVIRQVRRVGRGRDPVHPGARSLLQAPPRGPGPLCRQEMRNGRARCLGFLLGLAGEPTERLGHGAGPLCARHAPRRRRAALSAPSLPEAFPRFRGRMGRSDFPLPVPAPPVALGVGVPESTSGQQGDLPGSVHFPSLRADG